MDGLAIEACFEKSMLSDCGKIEEVESSVRSGMEPVWMEERDVEEQEEEDRHLESWEQGLVSEEEVRQGTETPQDLHSHSLSGSRSDENLIEAEFEMVLDYIDLPKKQEEPACSAGDDDVNPSGLHSTEIVDADKSEHEVEEEEKVVVWSAEEVCFSSSQSAETETSENGATEEAARPLDKDSASLAALIEQRDWNQVIDRLAVIESMPTVAVWTSGLDARGDSLLLEICKNQPTLQVIDVWLQNFPKDPERKCRSGRLPLHYACANEASAPVIEALIYAFPGSLMTADVEDKMLPLHHACKQGAQKAVIDYLLMAYPEATLVQDIHGRTPMDYAMDLADRSVRDRTVISIQEGLKQNLSTLSELLGKTHCMLAEEQDKVKELTRRIQVDEDTNGSKIHELHSLLEHTLARVAVLEKSEAEKVAQIEHLGYKLQGAQICLDEARRLLSAENREILTEKTREFEGALTVEQSKTDSLEQALVAKMELLVQEQERSENAIQKFTEIQAQLESERYKSQHLEMSLAEIDIEIEKSRIAKLEEMRVEHEAMIKENEEIIRALERSNEKKMEMLATQQEKVEALERLNREKETMLQKNQESIKVLESSIERKLFLQKGEEEKIRQLDILRIRKREMIEFEEEQVRKLDYTLSRKQALLELEQMKEKTLRQTIERKNALLETEKGKVEQLEKARAEQEILLASEQDIAQALVSSKKEKDRLMRAELTAVEELYEVLAEKEKLIEQKEMAQTALQQKIKEAESMVAKERELWESAKQIKDDSEAMLREADDDVRAVEIRASQKSSLLAKEEILTKSLEKFKKRHSQLASCGRLYTVVDTTLSISLLVKEVLLSRQHEEFVAQERKRRASSSSTATLVKQNIQNVLPVPSKLFRNHFSGNGRLYINQFIGFLGMSEARAKKYFSKSK
jgi:hypothetical protein